MLHFMILLLYVIIYIFLFDWASNLAQVRIYVNEGFTQLQLRTRFENTGPGPGTGAQRQIPCHRTTPAPNDTRAQFTLVFLKQSSRREVVDAFLICSNAGEKLEYGFNTVQ